MTMENLHRDYAGVGLDEGLLPEAPFPLLEAWLAAALGGGLEEPNAMTLATVGADGRPSARVVLLKQFDPGGFVFYTNYDSRKGQELSTNPHAALVFWWPPLARQVRAEGVVHKVSREESEQYFRTRPLGSRLGTWVSAQSQVISGRDVLDRGMEELLARYPDGDVDLPPFWGGFRLVPDCVEFWQGQPSRLHDRIRYSRQHPLGSWTRERLAP